MTAVIPRRQFARVKPLLSVRSPAEFRAQLMRSALLYFAGFYLVALVWRLDGFAATGVSARAALLTGIGFCSWSACATRCATRWNFTSSRMGVLSGLRCCWRCPRSRFSITAGFRDWCYTPLFAALALFGLLLAFGRGPAGNDAKVNLGPFQPVELIKILLVMFLAGYFTRNWERLRDLREERMLPGCCGASACRAWSTWCRCCAPLASRWCCSSC